MNDRIHPADSIKRQKANWSWSRLGKSSLIAAAGVSLLGLQLLTGPEPTYLLSTGVELGVIRNAELKWDPEPTTEARVKWWKPAQAVDLGRQRQLLGWLRGPGLGSAEATRVFWPGWTRRQLDSLSGEVTSIEKEVHSPARWSCLKSPVPVVAGARLTVADIGVLGTVETKPEVSLPATDMIRTARQFNGVTSIGFGSEIPAGRYMLGWLLVMDRPVGSLDAGQIPGAVHGVTFALTRVPEGESSVVDDDWFQFNFNDGVFGLGGPVLVCHDDYDHLTIRMRRHGANRAVKEGRILSLGHLALRLGDVMQRIDDELEQDDNVPVATDSLAEGSLVYLRLVNTPMDVKAGDVLEVELGGVPAELNPRFDVK